jgi:NAD(P)-dependent dehydrogenase (short-subunit alcohol dehydrogenase family)
MSSPTSAALKRKHASPARRSFEVAASASDKKYIPGGPIANALVVVTGANRGIGLEFCKQILAKSDGNSVVASCRDPSAATDLNALQKEMGASRLAIVALDVADEKSIAKWAEGLASLEPVKAHGGSISVVINNAGTTGTDGYSKWELQDMTAEEMMHVYRINTIGPMLVTQQLVKRGLVGSVAGSPSEGPVSLVGNVTSKVGSVDDNGSGKGYAYRASKAALNIVNKSMSIDLADRGVWCQLLHPGWVRTRMTEGRGLIDADESAAGLIKAMEGEYGPINGCWYDYKGDEIPW